MQKIFFIVLLALPEINASASVVFASDFGWNANDATSAFQSAIRSGADTIIVDKQSEDWITGPNTFSDLSDRQ